MWGAKSPKRIVMQFCAGVDVWDAITPANFASHRFRHFLMAGVEFQTFPLTFNVVLITLWHYRASVRLANWFAGLLLSLYNVSFVRAESIFCQLTAVQRGRNGDENNFCGNRWQWNVSLAGMGGYESKTGRRQVVTDIKSAGTSGDGCNLCPRASPLVVTCI